MQNIDQRLRQLRLIRKESIEHIATDAGITYKALSEIERGLTKHPSRENLYSILEVLNQCEPLGVEDWRLIFEAYGYKKPYPLPTNAEIETAKKQWREDYGHIVHPAYLVDCSQRLLDWNRYAPRLVGMHHDDISTKHFQNLTVFDIAFGLAENLVQIVNQEEYLPSFIHTTIGIMRPYQDEPWYAKSILAAQQKYPLFKELWESLHSDTFQASLTGLAVPIILSIPEESHHLTFQLVKVDFSGDERFWIVQWIPVDKITIHRCFEWVQEESDKS